MENFEKETAKVFGKRFRALMAANGDTSATATTKLNVSSAIIAKWRQGKVVPSGEYLKRISEIYCISSDYLLGLSNDALARADELSGASPRKLAKVIYESCRNAVEPLEDSQKDNIYKALTRENLDEVFERVITLVKVQTKCNVTEKGAKRTVLYQSIKHQSEELSEFLRLILAGTDTACNETLSTLSKETNGCVDAIRP